MMRSKGFSSWPCYTREEVLAASGVLESNKVNYWTGEECAEFEAEFARWTGTRRAVAVMNGTVALDLALIALGIGPGDEVVVTPRTFIASVSCVVNAGATPVFADVDSESGNLSAGTIQRVLTDKTKAIIVVHLAGWPCDMGPIMQLASDRGLKVIEDCAQAHGATYRGQSVGSIGDIGAWSFCQDKIMTTGGEGGMVTTNSDELWSRIWSFKDHGKSWESVHEASHPAGFRWVHHAFGTNWRMLEIQAAIGRLQLRKMPEWTAARNRNAGLLISALRQFDQSSGAIRVPTLSCANCASRESVATDRCRKERQCCTHAYYKFYAYVRPERLATGWSRDRIVEEINNRGVPCFHGSCPEVYLEKAFDSTPWRPTERLSIAKNLGETSLMWLVHPTLREEEIQKTCEACVDVIAKASR